MFDRSLREEFRGTPPILYAARSSVRTSKYTSVFAKTEWYDRQAM